MADEVAIKLNEDQKNDQNIVCKICDSMILKKNTCSVVKDKKELPYMKSKNDAGENLNDKREVIEKFWLVVDMFTFENVGFTNTLDQMKYLTCADCEVGPIGYQDLTNPKHMYVALSRVSYS